MPLPSAYLRFATSLFALIHPSYAVPRNSMLFVSLESLVFPLLLVVVVVVVIAIAIVIVIVVVVVVVVVVVRACSLRR